jgi:formyltetrahydrofolate deformylase
VAAELVLTLSCPDRPGIVHAVSGCLAEEFDPVAEQIAMTWDLHDSTDRPGVVVMVSRQGHCLNDLLYRWRRGHLPGLPKAVVSNHLELEGVSAELVVMARYMQVLSPQLCQRMVGRIINIHHSFVPSFAGGRPYDHAFTRGVKLIGATAHYATADLDDGPNIEQEVARVTHQQSPADLAGVGRDLECVALARAVRWHRERRALLDGSRTVVFP